MPPFKQPIRLLELARSRAGHLVHIVLSAAQKLRDADKPWQPTVQACQDYYRTFIPPTLWPVVCSLENIMQQFTFLTDVQSPYYRQHSCNYAPEIVLSFMVYDDVLKLVLVPSTYQCLSSGELNPFKDLTSVLSRLTIVVELNLGGIHVTDGLLVALGTNCKQLAKLKFSSEVRHRDVTDEGLLHLVLCRQLRYLEDEDKFAWAKSETIKSMLKSLPKLVFFNSMGMMLVLRELAGEENVAPLKLTTLSLYVKPTPNMIEIARLCPDVRKVELDFVGCQDEPLFRRSMISLAKYPLVCPTIKLKRFFLYGKTFLSFHRYLSVKGSEIRELSLCFPDSLPCIDRKLLVAIGETCPCIRDLEIVTQCCERPGVFRKARVVGGQTLAVATRLAAPSMFLHLNRLRLHGNQVVDHGDLLTVFDDARELVDISLRVTSEVWSLRSLENGKFGEMFAAGVFAKLRSLEIKSYHTMILTDHVQVILDNSPNLSFLSLKVNLINQFEEIKIYFDKLFIKIKKENLELHIYGLCHCAS